MDNIKVSGFRAVPSFPQGLGRDLRVRSALEELEELEMDYAVDLIDLLNWLAAFWLCRCTRSWQRCSRIVRSRGAANARPELECALRGI